MQSEEKLIFIFLHLTPVAGTDVTPTHEAENLLFHFANGTTLRNSLLHSVPVSELQKQNHKYHIHDSKGINTML